MTGNDQPVLLQKESPQQVSFRGAGVLPVTGRYAADARLEQLKLN
jgi:hypothetical protein